MLDSIPQGQLYNRNYKEYEVHFVVGGIIVDAKHTVSKAGNNYGILIMEDYSGQMEFRLFDGYKFEDKLYTKFKNFLQKDLFVVIRGILTPSLQRDKADASKIYRRVNIDITSIQPLESAAKNMIKNLKIMQKLDNLTKTTVDILTASLLDNKGNIPFVFEVTDEESRNAVTLMWRDCGVKLSAELLNVLEEFAAEDKLEFAINNKPYKIRNEYVDNEEFIEEDMVSD
jgi:DNA polymerase-3 subunit alpha